MPPVRQLAAACAVVAAVAGCGHADEPAEARGRCRPAPLVASPVEVPLGSYVTLSSGPAGCDIGYGDDRRYLVDLRVPGRSSRRSLGSVPVARDGSFSAELYVPTDVPTGETHVLVRGTVYDDPCGDEDTTSSCGGYAVRIVLVPGR